MELSALATEFRKGLESLYGERLAKVILFGSRARGTSRQDSDIDFLLVLRGKLDVNEEIQPVSPLSTSLSLHHDAVITCVYVSEDEFERSDSPLIRNVHREGVAA